MTHRSVSDHAVLRYLERVHGLDIEAVRRGIARKAARGIAAGACGVIVDGINFKISDGVVTTVMHAHRPEVGQCGPKPRRPRE